MVNEKLDGKKILLISNSERRKNLLKAVGIPFETGAVDIDEQIPEDMPYKKAALFLAEKKMAAAEEKYMSYTDYVFITADTTVWLNGNFLGKPSNSEQARDFLHALSGNRHEVITGVCVKYNGNVESFREITRVYFKMLEDWEIDYYVDNFNPYDKAGGYGIQDWIGMIGIYKIEGDYFNVVGLPLTRLFEILVTI